MQTGVIIGALVFFDVLMFSVWYFRAKKKVDAVSERIRKAHEQSKACAQAEKDEIAARELVEFAAEHRYNHLTFKDIVSLVPGELISEAARRTVLATLERNRCKK